MFPTTHDITLKNLQYTLPVLVRMLEAGNQVLVVSKPSLHVMFNLCDALADYKEQILFRFTIGSAQDEILSFWEPGAPPFLSRLSSLYFMVLHGYKTSVSMEPLLETEEHMVIALVEALEEGVTDAIWIGKMNKVADRLKRNGFWYHPDVQRRAHELIASQEDARIISLYDQLKDHPKIKWKESIKTVVGLDIPTEAGLDI